MIDHSTLPLDRQHADFIRHKFLAVPIAGTLLVVAHYAFPDLRFVLIPAIIVAIYLVTIVVLQRRYAALAPRGS